MSRVFSPEEEAFHWDDFEALPELGNNLLDLSSSLSNEPVSTRLDVMPTNKNALGVIQVARVPDGYSAKPLVVLEKLMKVKSFRGSRMPQSRHNAALVSRLSGAAALELHRPSKHGDLEPEELRVIYQTIHRRMADGYMRVVETDFSDRNARSLELYIAAGRLIVGSNAQFHGTNL